MRYEERHVLKSERAYSILRYIYNKEEGSYATEIAEELDFDRSLVSEILSKLEDMGVVEEGKRTQAQYYQVDIDGLHELFKDVWVLRLKEKAPDVLQSIKSDMKKDYERTEGHDPEDVEERHDFDIGFVAGEELHEFIKNYLKNYLNTTTTKELKDEKVEWNTESTLWNMILGDFFASAWSEHRRISSIRNRIKSASDEEIEGRELRELTDIQHLLDFINWVLDYGIIDKNIVTPGYDAFLDTKGVSGKEYARQVNKFAGEEIFMNADDSKED